MRQTSTSIFSIATLGLGLAMAVGAQAGTSDGSDNTCTEGDVFTISGGSPETVPGTQSPNPIPANTQGYADALLTTKCAGYYTFEYLGNGDAFYHNRFYVNGTLVFDTKDTSHSNDPYTVYLTPEDFASHSPFHFQTNVEQNGPSVFNGEGPGWGTYTYTSPQVTYANLSIFYAIEGGASSTSGNTVLLGLTDGYNSSADPNHPAADNDHEDLGVRITFHPGKPYRHGRKHGFSHHRKYRSKF